MTDEEPVNPEVREAAQKASLWVAAWADRENVDLEALSPAQWFVVAMKVPCSIRCWRVGVSIEVGRNEVCPECGKANAYTQWDRLLSDDGV